MGGVFKQNCRSDVNANGRTQRTLYGDDGCSLGGKKGTYTAEGVYYRVGGGHGGRMATATKRYKRAERARDYICGRLRCARSTEVTC